MRSTQHLSPKNGINFGSTSGVLLCDCSKANSFEATLTGNATLDITNLPPGQDCSILITQDVVGGHTVGFSGMTIEVVDAALLTPAPLAAAKTQWQFQGVSQLSGAGVCRLVSSSSAGSSGGSGSFVADWAALLALDATTDQTGTLVFVETLKRTFMLDKTSAAPALAYSVGAAIGGGQWLIASSDPTWVYQTAYYIDDTASAENTGLIIGSPIPIAEWSRRVNQPWPAGGITMLVHLLTDFGAGEFAFDCSLFGATNASSVQFLAAPKTKILNNQSISAVVKAVAAGANGTDGTITCALPFTTSVGKLGRVNAGARVGASFWILKDLGANTARIGSVGQGPGDPIEATLQVGDTFDTWDLITCLGTYRQNGECNNSFTYFENVAFADTVNVGGGSACLMGSCSLSGIVGVYSSTKLELDVCLLKADMFGYTNGFIYAFGGGALNAELYMDSGALVAFRNWTGQGTPLKFAGIAGGPAQYGVGISSWLAQFDLAVSAVDILPTCSFVMDTGADHWGSGIDAGGAGRIAVQRGGQYVYTNAPKLAGAAARDVSLVGQAITYAMLPAAHVDSGAFIGPRTATDTLLKQVQGVGSFLAIAGALRTLPYVITTLTGAQNVALTRATAYEINSALTGDTAISWTEAPDADATKHAQSWTLRYPAGTHHVTFPNTTISAADLAGIAYAERGGGIMLLTFFWGTDGRCYLASWACDTLANNDAPATFIAVTGASPVLTASTGVVVNACDNTVTTPSLPAITAANDGYNVVASAGAAMTISPAVGQTIDGAATYAVAANHNKVVLVARFSTLDWYAFPSA